MARDPVHLEIVSKTTPSVYTYKTTGSSTPTVDYLKTLVVTVINENPHVAGTLQNKLSIDVTSKDIVLAQPDNIVLKDEVFDPLRPEGTPGATPGATGATPEMTIPLGKDVLRDGPYRQSLPPESSPNFVAYVQYYVAIACLCLHPAKPGMARSYTTIGPGPGQSPFKSCAERSSYIVSRDFGRTAEAAPVDFDYTSSVQGVERFVIQVNGIRASLVDKVNGTTVLNVDMTAIRPDRVNHTILVFLYYAMAHVLAVTSGGTGGTMNDTNLGLILNCWRTECSAGGIQQFSGTCWYNAAWNSLILSDAMRKALRSQFENNDVDLVIKEKAKHIKFEESCPNNDDPEGHLTAIYAMIDHVVIKPNGAITLNMNKTQNVIEQMSHANGGTSGFGAIEILMNLYDSSHLKIIINQRKIMDPGRPPFAATMTAMVTEEKTYTIFNMPWKGMIKGNLTKRSLGDNDYLVHFLEPVAPQVEIVVIVNHAEILFNTLPFFDTKNEFECVSAGISVNYEHIITGYTCNNTRMVYDSNGIYATCDWTKIVNMKIYEAVCRTRNFVVPDYIFKKEGNEYRYDHLVFVRKSNTAPKETMFDGLVGVVSNLSYK